MNTSAEDRAGTYIHGSAPAEQRRLSRLNDLLNEASLRELKLQGGETILDVGSGIAQFTRAMAKAAGNGARVLGIERDAEQLAEAARQARADGEDDLVELRAGDAGETFPSTTTSGVPSISRTRGSCSSMFPTPWPLSVAWLAPFAPEAASSWPMMIMIYFASGRSRQGCMPLWQAYIRSYDRLGNDPCVGRRLVSTPARSRCGPHPQ